MCLISIMDEIKVQNFFLMCDREVEKLEMKILSGTHKLFIHIISDGGGSQRTE